MKKILLMCLCVGISIGDIFTEWKGQPSNRIFLSLNPLKITSKAFQPRHRILFDETDKIFDENILKECSNNLYLQKIPTKIKPAKSITNKDYTLPPIGDENNISGISILIKNKGYNDKKIPEINLQCGYFVFLDGSKLAAIFNKDTDTDWFADTYYITYGFDLFRHIPIYNPNYYKYLIDKLRIEKRYYLEAIFSLESPTDSKTQYFKGRWFFGDWGNNNK